MSCKSKSKVGFSLHLDYYYFFKVIIGSYLSNRSPIGDYTYFANEFIMKFLIFVTIFENNTHQQHCLECIKNIR